MIWIVIAILLWALAWQWGAHVDAHRHALVQRAANVIAIVAVAVAWQQDAIHWGALVFPLATLRIKPSREGAAKTALVGTVWVLGWWWLG
jgi:hypothetical protein